jgi:hypothetical protein
MHFAISVYYMEAHVLGKSQTACDQEHLQDKTRLNCYLLHKATSLGPGGLFFTL